MGLVTLTFDLLILKLVCESHLRWGAFLPNWNTLGLWVLELFATYAIGGQTDRQTDGQKQLLLPPSLRAGHNNLRKILNGYISTIKFFCGGFGSKDGFVVTSSSHNGSCYIAENAYIAKH